MVIDVRKLKFSGKLESEFEFDYCCNDNLLTLPGAKFDGTVKVNGTLELHGDDVYVDGTLVCAIVGECARCLRESRVELKTPFSVVYATERQDEDDYLYHGGLVDLTDAVNDLIITSLPTVMYCKEDCKGLCYACGKNLNDGPCDCK